MTRADLVHEIAERTGLGKTDIRFVLETFFEVVKESIQREMSVQIRGFGSFFRKKKASKKARNISSGTTIEIPAREVPAFKPGREFFHSLK